MRRGLCRGQAGLFLLEGGSPTPKLLLLYPQSSLLNQSPARHPHHSCRLNGTYVAVTRSLLVLHESICCVRVMLTFKSKLGHAHALLHQPAVRHLHR